MYITCDKGTMFGGKSSALHKRYRQYQIQQRYGEPMKILVIKHSIDTRYGGNDHIITHDGKKIPCIRVQDLNEIEPSQWDVIFIDEAQFFLDLKEWVERYFCTCVTRVHIAGLNGDKNQKNFGDINLISPYCSEEQVHYSMCIRCGNPAPFTKCRADSQEQTLIGGDDEYYTVCVHHLNS